MSLNIMASVFNEENRAELGKCVKRYDAFFLRSVRCALWELAEQLSDKEVTIAPGAMNALGIVHDDEHELLRCWTKELTDEWGFYPYKVEHYQFQTDPDDEESGFPCFKIVFTLTEKLSKHFVTRGCAEYDFSAIVENDDESIAITYPQDSLGHIFAASLQKHTAYDHIQLAGLLEIYDELQKELLFQLMKYGHLSFELYD
jgi:hypothetical protein